MRSLRVELDEDTLDALEMERRLIGFDSRGEYVQWLIDHRGSIAEESTDAESLLDAYRDRIATLERQLAEQADREPRTVRRSESDHVHDDARSAATRESGKDDGWTRSKSIPSVKVRGSPRTTVSRSRPPEAGGDPKAETADSHPGTLSATESDRDRSDHEPATESDRPEPNERSTTDSASQSNRDEMADPKSRKRIARIRDERLAEDADVLEAVEVGRLDELSRRAVAKTRSRLNRPVETGLEYQSLSALTDETVGPGEDVVDLDSISVPGHDDELTAARREAIGRAIAFLRDEETARKSDFVDALYDSNPAGYETVDSWWRCLKTGLRQVETIEGGDGSRLWRFIE